MVPCRVGTAHGIPATRKEIFGCNAGHGQHNRCMPTDRTDDFIGSQEMFDLAVGEALGNEALGRNEFEADALAASIEQDELDDLETEI